MAHVTRHYKGSRQGWIWRHIHCLWSRIPIELTVLFILYTRSCKPEFRVSKLYGSGFTEIWRWQQVRKRHISKCFCLCVHVTTPHVGCRCLNSYTCGWFSWMHLFPALNSTFNAVELIFQWSTSSKLPFKALVWGKEHKATVFLKEEEVQKQETLLWVVTSGHC